MMYQPCTPLTMTGAKNALAEGLYAIESGTSQINLALITVTDSAAVAILLAWQRAALARGTTLAFHNASATLRSLAKLYGVAELLHFVTDSAQAADDTRH